jgi:mono/diheme cytochrome c family protein
MMTKALIAVAAAGLFAATPGAQGREGSTPPAGPSPPPGASAQQPAATQKPTTTGQAAAGKELYLDYSCWACHGYNAQTGNGARLLPPRVNERQFTLYLRAPRTPQMPAYSIKVMSDADAANIYAYLLSLPREPEVKDVPLLNQLPK